MEFGFFSRNKFRGHSAFTLWIWETPKSRQVRFIVESSLLDTFRFMFAVLYSIIMVFETFSQSVIPGVLHKLLFKQENELRAEFPVQKDDVENMNVLDLEQESSRRLNKKKVKKRRRREKKKNEETTDERNQLVDRELEEKMVENEEEFLDMNSAFVTLAVGRKRLGNSSVSGEGALPKARDRSTKLHDEDNDIKCVAASERLAIQGCRLASKEHHERAIDAFTKAIELTPDDYRFYGNRSFCFCQLGQHKRALKDADRAISLAPENAKGYFRKGEALRALKKYEEARIAFRHVLKLDQDCEDARAELRYVDKEFLEISAKDNSHQSSSFTSGCSQSSGGSLSSGGSSPLGDLQYSSRVDSKMDPTNPDGSCSLWIGNISSAITEQQLSEIFSKYGLVTSVRILPKKFCAFVNFQDASSAGQAMKHLQRMSLGGERILIRFPDKISVTPQKSHPCSTSSSSSPHPVVMSTKLSLHSYSKTLSGPTWNYK